MRLIRISETLARAAATDAGNRSMRGDGRKVWSMKDFNAACKEFERLWPVEKRDDEPIGISIAMVRP
jgi:hypothetical protein